MSTLSRRDRLAAHAHFLAELGLNTAQQSARRAREAFDRRLHTRLADAPVTRLRPAPRVAADDLDALRRHHRQGSPVIIEGLYEHWPARARWSMAYFREAFGERRFEVNVQGTRHRRTAFREMALADIIDSFEDPGGEELNYIMFSPVLKTIPELRDDIDLDTVRRFAGLGPDRRVWVKLFFGPAGTRTSLHMAPQSNLFFQVAGEKRWVMFAPSQSPLIEANRILPTGLPYFFSDYAYRDEPGDERFPLTDFLEGYDIHLRGGDALWVPPFHWHWVHALTPSISLSTWWYDPLISLRASPFFFALSLPGLIGIMAGRYDVDDFDRERTATIRRRLRMLVGRKKP